MTEPAAPAPATPDDPANAPAPAKRPAFVDISLAAPVARDGGDVARVRLRKPRAGDLRGLTMQNVLQSDATTIIQLVPRISEPALTEHEVSALEADDFAEIAGTLFGFFMTPAQHAMIAKLAG